MSTRAIVIAVVAVLAVIGGGVAMATARQTTASETLTLTPSPEPTATDAITPQRTAEQRNGQEIDRAEAERRALDEVGGGEVVKTERESDDDDREWEVHVRQNGAVHEVKIAADGRVLSTEIDDDDDWDGRDDDDRNDRPAAGANAISQDRAERIALDAVGGGTVRSAHLDDDDSGDEWELVVIDTADRLIEVEIDAATGQVEETDLEDR